MFIKIYFNIKKFKKIYFCFSKINESIDGISINNIIKENDKFIEEKKIHINKGVCSNIYLFNKKNKIKNINSKKTIINKNSFKNIFFKNSKKNTIGSLNKKLINDSKIIKKLPLSVEGVENLIFNSNELKPNKSKSNDMLITEKKINNKNPLKKQKNPFIDAGYSDELNKSIENFILKKRKKEKIIILAVNFLKKYKRIVVDYEIFYKTILSLYKNKFFLIKFLKLKIYTLFYENILKSTKGKKKYLILQLKKKKSKYLIILIINNKIEMMVTLGVLLSYAGQKKKSLKRSAKGFEIFLNAVETIYINFKKGDYVRSLILDFLDKKIFISKKKIIKLFASSNFFFFSFYTNFGKNFYKKYRSIKKNFLKKNVVFFNKDIRKFYLKTSKKITRFK